MSIIQWFNDNSWALFAYYATGLMTAAICTAIHMKKIADFRQRLYLVFLALIFTFIGCIIAGLQAGNAPYWEPVYALPWVRLTWTIAITLVIAECMMYLNHLRKEP